MRSSPECRVIVEEARLYHLLPDRRHQLTSPRTRHRRNTNTTTVSTSHASLITSQLFLVTSSFTKTITHHHKLLLILYKIKVFTNFLLSPCLKLVLFHPTSKNIYIHTNCVCFVQVIVAVGGEDNKLVLRSVECFDPLAHSWRSLSCLPFAVRCVTKLAVKPYLWSFGLIYVCLYNIY